MRQATERSLERLTPEQRDDWERDGYLVVRGMFSDEEVREIRDRFERLGEGESAPDWAPDLASDDPLKRYPRVMQPHRFCPLSKRMLLKPEIGAALQDLFGEPAVACQSMYYFKPPGSPGQALHQDNFYLGVQPGTCVAAWTAIDRADPDNGGLYVVPESHKLDVICPDAERLRAGRASNIVDPPKGMKAVPAVMEPGDTLFFSGSVIHGSGRNRTADRWRRSFIGHYMPAGSTHVNRHYFPILTFAGETITFEAATEGGPCGEALGAIAASYGMDAIIH